MRIRNIKVYVLNINHTPVTVSTTFGRFFVCMLININHTSHRTTGTIFIANKGSAKYFFFLEKCLKKTTEYFLKFLFFYLKVQSFRLIMENNFIQMAATAGHAVAYTFGPIIKHIIDCVQLYFTNGFTNIVL